MTTNKPTIDCECYFGNGLCSNPHAPQPIWRRWPRCILGSGDVRVACCLRRPTPAPMPPTAPTPINSRRRKNRDAA